MNYAKLKPDGTFDYQIPTDGNFEWDETHFCPASALTSEEAKEFGVVKLFDGIKPVHDPIRQYCFQNGADFIDDEWHVRWSVASYSDQEIAARAV